MCKNLNSAQSFRKYSEVSVSDFRYLGAISEVVACKICNLFKADTSPTCLEDNWPATPCSHAVSSSSAHSKCDVSRLNVLG